MQIKFFKNLFKKKVDEHREKLLQDYRSGKMIKFEKPNKNKGDN